MKLPSHYFRFSAQTTLRLSRIAIVALWGGYFGKFFLQTDQPGLLVLLRVCLVVGTILSILLFVSAHSFVGSAFDHHIYERELTLRNRAYFKTIQCVMVGLIAHFFGIEIAEHQGISLMPNVYQNFGLCLFFTTLIVPAWYLARWHAANSDA